MSRMIKAALAATLATLSINVAQAQRAPSLPSAVTPGIIGNTVQVGVGDKRIGTPNGLIGPAGTPTTKVGVGLLTPSNAPQGSVATVTVPADRRQ